MIQAGKIETEQSRRKLQTKPGTTSDTLKSWKFWRREMDAVVHLLSLMWWLGIYAASGKRAWGISFSFYTTANEALALLLASEINVNHIKLTISAYMLGKMFWWRPGEALSCLSFASFAYRSPSHSVPKSVCSRLCCSFLTGWIMVTYKLNGKSFESKILAKAEIPFRRTDEMDRDDGTVLVYVMLMASILKDSFGSFS